MKATATITYDVKGPGSPEIGDFLWTKTKTGAIGSVYLIIGVHRVKRNGDPRFKLTVKRGYGETDMSQRRWFMRWYPRKKTCGVGGGRRSGRPGHWG